VDAISQVTDFTHNAHSSFSTVIDSRNDVLPGVHAADGNANGDRYAHRDSNRNDHINTNTNVDGNVHRDSNADTDGDEYTNHHADVDSISNPKRHARPSDWFPV
jgi:hypothetical protein